MNGSSSQAASFRLSFLVGLVAAAAIVAALAGTGCGSASNAQPTPGAQSTPWANQPPTVQPTSGAQSTPGANQPPTVQPTPKTIMIDPGDNPSKGPTDAKVTIVEFADFQGPNCGLFATQTLPQILSNYGDKVRFVFMNYPLTKTDPYSEQAAEAGECANAQGAFWQFHDLVFQNQQVLTNLLTPDPTAGPAKVVERLKGYAAQLGLDTTSFNDCLDSGRMAGAVQADKRVMLKAGQDAGLATFGLPEFFINGNFLSGAKPYDVFKQMIDTALAAAK